MKLTIYQGTNEVGGNCFELSSGKDRILFDCGLPLSSMEDKKQIDTYKLSIKGLYADEHPDFKAIFISHAHPDHYGMLELINTKIPVYMSKISKALIFKAAPLLGTFDVSALNIIEIDNGDIIQLGNLSIKAHLVDHSAAGSLGFEVIADGKKVVYSGDIRFHGRTKYLSYAFAKAIKNPDYLIMEGSTLSRVDNKPEREIDVESKLAGVFKSPKLTIISFSSQNLERFVSVYKACLRAKKTLVIDPYTAFLLELFKPISGNIPQFDWNNIRVYCAQNGITSKLAEKEVLKRYGSKKISIEEILSTSDKFIIKDNFRIAELLLSKVEKSRLQVVYSMWQGYLNKTDRWDGYDIIHIHASGHAAPKDLQEFVQRTEPKCLIPIHTECKNEYKGFFDAKVQILEDGEVLDL